MTTSRENEAARGGMAGGRAGKRLRARILLTAAALSLSCARTDAQTDTRQTMKDLLPRDNTLKNWIAREAIPFSAGSPASFNAAVDRLAADLDDRVELLGFGEALHGGEDILVVRNRLFQRLAEAHGFSAVAVESSLARSRLVDDYIGGGGPSSYDAVRDEGFSHGFGALEANRELVEWMRRYNADPSHPVKLRFYGFDSPTEMTGTESPRALLGVVLDYLEAVDPAEGKERRARIETLLGRDADWENPAAMMDPAQSVGLTPAAAALRIEAEDLITHLRVRRPELAAKSGPERLAEALHYAAAARDFLDYHAALAGTGENRVADCLGLRDAMMAENLAYIVSGERGRGRVLAFAHNGHLQRRKTEWQLGPQLLAWWPAGAQLHEIFGPRYAAIGSAVGTSEANGIGRPEAGTLEALLTAFPGPGLLIPTHRGEGLPAAEISALTVRSASKKNTSYFPLAARSFTDFDWLLSLDTTGYSRGGPPLP